MFQLTKNEIDTLQNPRSQIVILESGQNVKYPPMAFTEQGVAMLSGILRSPQAVQVNIAIMRTFVQLRYMMDANKDLAKKITSLEKKYDGQFELVFKAIQTLISEDTKPKKEIGFHTKEDKAK